MSTWNLSGDTNLWTHDYKIKPAVPHPHGYGLKHKKKKHVFSLYETKQALMYSLEGHQLLLD